MADRRQATPPRGVQERLEKAPAGRALISVFLLFTVFSLVVWNLPDSEVKRQALGVVRPYVNAVGLDQNWGVFAPDPRRQTTQLFARVTYADGREETWRVPSGDPVVGEYWDYRWRKWAEWAIADAYDHLWQPAAEWFARRAGEHGEVEKVVLVRRWYDLYPPGPGPARGEWQEFEYYTLTVTDA
jgi:hypothetical protein